MLSRVTATKLLGHSEQGQTLPLIFDCRTERGLKETFQVKVASVRNDLSNRELACEMLCTMLSRALGLHVSVPAFVDLSPGLVKQIDETYGMGVTEMIGAGVRWIEYLAPFIPAISSVSHSHGQPYIPESCRLLAFDLIMTNGDRTMANPNVAWDGNSLLVFDFEHCLELPGKAFSRKLEVHLELLPNLRESHIFGSTISTSMLKDELAWCLDMLREEVSKTEILESAPVHLRPDWLQLLGYMEYLSQNRDVIISAAVAES